jgi:hypothetical protein
MDESFLAALRQRGIPDANLEKMSQDKVNNINCSGSCVVVVFLSCLCFFGDTCGVFHKAGFIQ